MIVKLVYTAANMTPANLRADLKQMLLGTMTTSTDGNSVTHPSNLNASSTDSIVYGTTYTNSNSIYVNTDSSVRYYTKKHSVYTSDTPSWFGLGTNSSYISAEVGLDNSNKAVKKYATDLTTLKCNNASVFLWVVISDTTFAVLGTGTTGSDGFILTDIAKNGLSLSFTDSSTIGLGIFDATSRVAFPYVFSPKTNLYVTEPNLLFTSTSGTPPIWDSNLSKHRLCLNHLYAGNDDYGSWHIFGMSGIDNYPLAVGFALMQDSSNVYYLNVGRALLASAAAGVLIKGE